jgi:DNA-binding MarR family transcriptional regulator
MVKPRSSATHVFVHLDQLSRRGQRDARRLFDTAEPIPGLRGSIGRILSLVPPEGARQTVLADGAWITKQSLGERIREMEELGWVMTDADPHDKRAHLVHRTERGNRVLAVIEATIAAMEVEWSAQVGDERFIVFRTVLAELATGDVVHAIEPMSQGRRSRTVRSSGWHTGGGN